MTKAPRTGPLGDAGAIDWTGIRREHVEYAPGSMIFRQGEPARSVMYISAGSVRLSVVSLAGKEAVIAVRIEADLVDHLFKSSEKRLARTLLLLARYGEPDASHRTLPKLSQEPLAEMVGTTRSRVNVFMNQFRRLGFIDYNGGLTINNSLLSVVLRD